MPKYTTRPFEVEAVQFKDRNWTEVMHFVGKREVDEDYWIYNFQKAGSYANWDDEAIVAEVYDKLHSTWVGVRDDDFIIKGSKGEFYPCDAEVFEAKYEEVPTVVRTDGNVTWYSDGSMEVKEVHNG